MANDDMAHKETLDEEYVSRLYNRYSEELLHRHAQLNADRVRLRNYYSKRISSSSGLETVEYIAPVLVFVAFIFILINVVWPYRFVILNFLWSRKEFTISLTSITISALGILYFYSRFVERTIASLTSKVESQARDVDLLQKLIDKLLSELQQAGNSEKSLDVSQRSEQVKKTQGNIQQEECDHWKQLVEVHVKVMRILELQQAQQGDAFHYSRKIELDERRKRVNELGKVIEDNC